MIKILALVLFVTSHIFSNTGYNVMKKVYDENKKIIRFNSNGFSHF